MHVTMEILTQIKGEIIKHVYIYVLFELVDTFTNKIEILDP